MAIVVVRAESMLFFKAILRERLLRFHLEHRVNRGMDTVSIETDSPVTELYEKFKHYELRLPGSLL